jgi:hypothetical protein
MRVRTCLAALVLAAAALGGGSAFELSFTVKELGPRWFARCE